jgi:protein-S-isoprenylcysteine O-methyltransferase Ste14
MLKKQGIEAVEFGRKDKKDFVLIPFVIFYFYQILAHTFRWPSFDRHVFFNSEAVSWAGSMICLIAFAFFLWTMLSFRKSFRVGLMDNREQGLITNGAFAISRNPIYVSFITMLAGQFLIFPNWILLLYFIAGTWRIHIQVLKEEQFLADQYSEAYRTYRKKVRRYL